MRHVISEIRLNHAQTNIIITVGIVILQLRCGKKLTPVCRSNFRCFYIDQCATTPVKFCRKSLAVATFGFFSKKLQFSMHGISFVYTLSMPRYTVEKEVTKMLRFIYAFFNFLFFPSLTPMLYIGKFVSNISQALLHLAF